MTASNSSVQRKPRPDGPMPRSRQAGTRLTRLEEDMLRCAAAGERVDLAEGPVDLATMKTWGHRRTIRAAVLRHLLVGEDWPVHAKG
jgi:hypothetical protein